MSIVPSRFSRERRGGSSTDNAASPPRAAQPAAIDAHTGEAPPIGTYSAVERFEQMRSGAGAPAAPPPPPLPAHVAEWTGRNDQESRPDNPAAPDQSLDVEASTDEDVQIYIDPHRPIGSSSAILTSPEFAPDRSAGVGANAQELSGGVVTIMAPDFRPKEPESGKRRRGKRSAKRHAPKRDETESDNSPEAPKARSGNLVRVGVTGLAAIAVIALVGSRLLGGTAEPAPTQIVSAAEWDERVIDLVDFVQTTRGAEFSNPIGIEILDVAGFRAARFEDEQLRAAGDGDRGVVAQTVGRALGISIDQTSSDTDVDALAVYLPATKRIVVRADGDVTELDEARRADVISQLVLALDDQQFSYTRPRMFTSQVQVATSIASADAQLVREAWLGGPSGVDARGFQSAGSALAEQLIISAGITSMEPLLAAPPNTTEWLFDPTQLPSAASPRAVTAPFVGSVDTMIGQDDIGPLTWLAVLSTEVDRATTLRAVYGWGGDVAIAFTKDDRSCMAAAIRGDTPTDDAELEAALTTWAAAKPDDRIVTRIGNQIEVSACEPSALDPVDATELIAASFLISDVANLWMDEKISQEDARCVALNTIIGRADGPLLPYTLLDRATLKTELAPDMATWAAHCDVYLPGVSPTAEFGPSTPFTIENSRNPFRTTTTLG